MRRQLADGSTIRNQKFVVEYFCRPGNCKTGHFHVVKRMRTATSTLYSQRVLVFSIPLTSSSLAKRLFDDNNNYSILRYLKLVV